MTKVNEFCKEVELLAEKYGLSFFLVTEGASVTRNNNCEAIRAARLAHIKWEKDNYIDIPAKMTEKEKEEIERILF